MNSIEIRLKGARFELYVDEDLEGSEDFALTIEECFKQEYFKLRNTQPPGSEKKNLEL